VTIRKEEITRFTNFRGDAVSLGTAIAQSLDGRPGVRFPEGVAIFLYAYASRPALGPTEPLYPMGI